MRQILLIIAALAVGGRVKQDEQKDAQGEINCPKPGQPRPLTRLQTLPKEEWDDSGVVPAEWARRAADTQLS